MGIRFAVLLARHSVDSGRVSEGDDRGRISGHRCQRSNDQCGSAAATGYAATDVAFCQASWVPLEAGQQHGVVLPVISVVAPGLSAGVISEMSPGWDTWTLRVGLLANAAAT
ncbi:hypothetical protein MUBE_04185 [Mycobacterium uberis]|uniref:Uncharacterized protein n=1 Tax=Mycobacterium uberis TaxID=2162698 RepID=A0A3E1HJH2_9MYCO|nr:hypothetical protein [Mycobacterium uberis]RFD26449.1 hypothetical protein MUBE_04185 [Mycobacterium uberis]